MNLTPSDQGERRDTDWPSSSAMEFVFGTEGSRWLLIASRYELVRIGREMAREVA